MTTRNISLHEVILRDRDRQRLRGLLLAGAESAPAGVADADYFAGLRRRVKKVVHTGTRNRTQGTAKI